MKIQYRASLAKILGKIVRSSIREAVIEDQAFNVIYQTMTLINKSMQRTATLTCTNINPVNLQSILVKAAVLYQ